jgi:hypothetical protein
VAIPIGWVGKGLAGIHGRPIRYEFVADASSMAEMRA